MEKTKKKGRLFFKLFWIFILGSILSVVVLFTLISRGHLGFIPSFEDLENPKSNLATEIYSSDLKLLGVYFKENRSNAKFEELSPSLINALIATEDIRYFDHAGIDAKALARAIFGALTFNPKGGASTITQQLAKQLYHDASRNILKRIKQKMNEWVIAIKLEKRYTKNEIITMYFNKFDFLNLAVGIKSASRVYFSSTPDSLKIEEAAMLVGMAKNPSLYNPLRRLELTTNRRNVVLNQMCKYEYITEVERDSLKHLPIVLDFQKVDHKEGIATYFREYLRATLSAREPNRAKYFDVQQYREDSTEWADNALYGWCNKKLKPDGSRYNIYKDGLKIYTTINSKMQRYAEEAISEHLGGTLQDAFFKENEDRKKAPFSNDVSQENIDRIMYNSMRRCERYRVHKVLGIPHDTIVKIFQKPIPMKVFSWKGDIDTTMSPMDSIRYYKFFLRSSFMSMEPQTGFVKAYVGGINYKHFQYDQVKVGRRQVGSTFKPFIYTVAMRDNKMSPCYRVTNIRYTFEMPDGQPPYTPKYTTAKFLEKYEGENITLKFGLAHSMNQISAWVLKQTTPQAAIDLANDMGIRSKMEAFPSICVGIPEILLSEMVGAYSTFANKGVYTTPLYVTRIEDKNGNVLTEFVPQRREALSEEVSYVMLDLMKGVTQHGTSVRLRYRYKFTAEMAGKTGTTNNHSDGWFMGITPNLVSGTWVGGEERSIHFRGLSMGQGASTALPVWAIYMKKVYEDKSLPYTQEDTFDKPERVSIELDCGKFDQMNQSMPKDDPLGDY